MREYTDNMSLEKWIATHPEYLKTDVIIYSGETNERRLFVGDLENVPFWMLCREVIKDVFDEANVLRLRPQIKEVLEHPARILYDDGTEGPTLGELLKERRKAERVMEYIELDFLHTRHKDDKDWTDYRNQRSKIDFLDKQIDFIENRKVVKG